MRLFEIAGLVDENRGWVPSGDVGDTLVRVEPVEVYGAGFLRLPLRCCYEHVGLYPWQRDPPGGTRCRAMAARREEGS